MTEKYKKILSQYKDVMNIAIDSLSQYPPKNWSISEQESFLNFYKSEKDRRLKIVDGKFATLQSLKININDALIYFNEGSGEAVEKFWKEVKEENLPFKRENKLKKILKRQRIKNDIEYNFLIDVITPYMQEGLISMVENTLLNEYIGEFEIKKTRP